MCRKIFWAITHVDQTVNDSSDFMERVAEGSCVREGREA